MYFDDHNPPHFHAIYQDSRATFDFDGNVLEGSMPSKQLKLILAWAAIHEEELEANWLLTSNGDAVFNIDPLR